MKYLFIPCTFLIIFLAYRVPMIGHCFSFEKIEDRMCEKDEVLGWKIELRSSTGNGLAQLESCVETVLNDVGREAGVAALWRAGFVIGADQAASNVFGKIRPYSDDEKTIFMSAKFGKIFTSDRCIMRNNLYWKGYGIKIFEDEQKYRSDAFFYF